MASAIHGGTRQGHRDKAIETFDKEADCTVMMARAGAGGEGLSLTYANHVMLVD